MLELFIVFALILLNGFFAMSEMSVMTSRKSRLKQMAKTSLRAKHALQLSEKPENFLSTVQIGITLIGVLTGVFGAESLGQIISTFLLFLLPQFATYIPTVSVGIAVTFITFLTLIFGELVPKRIAITHSEKIASIVAMPMNVLAKVAAPAVVLLAVSTRLVLRVLHLGKDSPNSITEEEIRMLVTESHEQGVIDSHERDLMNRAMRLGERTADTMMTPRNRIVWLNTEQPLAKNLQIIRNSRMSRFPVYRGNDQEVLGILEVKSLFGRTQNENADLFSELHQPLFVAESTHAMKLLEIFREEQQSLALVVDEYGEIQGLVSTSDLMGAMVGRLQSTENNDDSPWVVKREDGSLLVDGSLPNDDLRELLEGIPLPNEDEENYNTLAGMCIDYFGRIPHVGEYFEWSGWRFEVVDLDGARVDKLLLTPLVSGQHSSDPPNGS